MLYIIITMEKENSKWMLHEPSFVQTLQFQKMAKQNKMHNLIKFYENQSHPHNIDKANVQVHFAWMCLCEHSGTLWWFHTWIKLKNPTQMCSDRAERIRDEWRTNIWNLHTIEQTSKGGCLITFNHFDVSWLLYYKDHRDKNAQRHIIKIIMLIMLYQRVLQWDYGCYCAEIQAVSEHI